MGNFNAKLRWAAEAPERDAAELARRRRLDEMHPPLERPCGTPGAVYTIVVDGRDIGCTAHLPFEISSALPTEAAEEMKQALHGALLPIVETFYRRVWDQTIAGRVIGDDPEPMPKRWELLFTRWLKRCFARGESPLVEGEKMWSENALPDAYRWWVR